MRLLDDPISTQPPRPLRRTFLILAGSGQITGHHLSRNHALKIVDRVFWLFGAVLLGLYAGWMIWGVRG